MKKRRGLTLVEVGIALGIVAVLMVPSAAMWLNSSKANQASGQLVDALVLAQLIMESKIRDVPYASQAAAHATDAQTGFVYDLALTQLTTTLRRADVTITLPGDSKPILRLATLSAKEI